MMSVWSRRPHFLHLGLFTAAYVLGCGFAQALAIVPGTGISIWPPSGLFMATLILASRHSWPWWVLGGCLAELFSNALWFHNPLSVALLIYTGNVLEAVAGAWLVTWACRRPFRLETLQEVLTLVVLGAGIAPVASATVGSATLAWFGMQTFAAAWPLFWLGDATGVLIVAPLALAVLQNCGGRTQLSAARWMEACVLGLIFLGVAALSLSGHLPSAYIVMPPLLWAAVRFEFKGAAVALTLLALITVVFTISGTSQFVGDPEFQKQMQFALQLFLAISAFSVLTVAAVSRQHQQALLTLRDSERELSQLVDMVPSHVWRLTPDGEPTFFNKRMIDFLGLDVADLDKRGMSRLEAVIETIHPDEAIGFGDALRRSLATGENFALRYRLRRADGVYHWMSSRAEPMRDQNGRIVQWYGLCHDIDDQMHAEEALRRSERELQQLVDALPVHVWSWTPDGKLAYVNKRSLEELGLSGANFEGSTMVAQKLVHPEDAPEVLRTSANCLKAGDAFMMRYRRRCKDGSYRWMEGRCEPLRDQDGTIVHWYQVSIDIDDQMHAEEALRRSERQLQQMIDAVPVRIWSVRPTGGPIYFNKRYQDHFRAVIPNFDALGEPRIETLLQELIHPEDASEVQCTLRNCFDTGGGSAMRFRWREKDGAYRWAECRVEPRRDQDGVIAEWYGVSLDIDHEVRAQEALRERERELSLLVEMVPSHLWRVSPEGETTFANKHMADYFGLDVEDKPRMEAVFNTMFHPDEVDEVWDVFARCLRTGEPFSMTYRLRRHDGVYRWMSGRAEPMRDESGRIVQWFGLCHDIDNQVRAEEALRRASERLARATQAASLAELSASIGHEVNQPLAAIVANSQACHRWLSAEPPNVERAKITAERITRDANSAADVVSRIRALFRQTTNAKSSENINRVISEVCRLMADEIAAKDIRVETNLEPDLPPVALDCVQVQQVLVNLIRNGIEAMEAVVEGARALQIRSSRDDLHAIRVEVRDTGTGFKDADRVFEPFFTTKQHGMGMGLAICRSIIESHGGSLWTANDEARGATVAFTLPLATNGGSATMS
ncbi:PAS domain-containing protein [Mesorhizobium ventifaucium]|uniref:histidine kinase n=1 Tax=Mesorhizobium ventifaucium TaxID=666020 RepID=A0ABM9DR21_9HYPH|nr:PAS domain-containing protein [Mesorhizobium ventifaucium]CAH2398576.1 Histidine kinase [Mesorhizobium ventifaucium]